MYYHFLLQQHSVQHLLISNHNPLPEPVVCIIGGYCAYIKDTGIPSNLMRPEIREYIEEHHQREQQRINQGVG